MECQNKGRVPNVKLGVSMPPLYVPCGRCRPCQYRRLMDLEGRGRMEAAVSDWSVLATLTYRNDDGLPYRVDGAEQVVDKKHFQDAFKRLRRVGDRRGFSARYFVAAESGGLRGRVHFHSLIFGDGERPNWPSHGRRFWDDVFWPHGHIHAAWTDDPKSIRYVLKYSQKDRFSVSRPDAFFSFSNRPILGAAGIAALGSRCAELQVLPRNGRYVLPGVMGNDSYNLSGRGRFRLVEAAVVSAAERGTLLNPGQCSDLVLNDIVRLRVAERKEIAETAYLADGGDFITEMFLLTMEEKYSRYEKRRRLAPGLDEQFVLDEVLENIAQGISQEYSARDRRRRRQFLRAS